MLRNIIYAYRLHIHDMFDEMPIMDSRGPVKVLNKHFISYCHFLVSLLL